MNSPETSLAMLEHADLIRRLRELDAAYHFKHNLIQESAYSSLLRNDRRNLHRAAAQALEQAYAEDIDANSALLAKHYLEAGDEDKTYFYARRAGDAARRMSAYDEALMQYDTAALLAPRLNVPIADFVSLHQARGRTLELMGKYDDAKAAYHALHAIGQMRHEPLIELGALLPLATLQIFPNATQNLKAALRVNQEALKLARESGDAECQARALWNMVLYSYFTGHAAESLRYGKEGLAIADQHGLLEMRGYLLNDMSRSMVSASTVTDALQALEQARAIWIETQNLPMLADNLATATEMSFISGDLDGFERFYKQATDLCLTIGNTWNLTYVEGSRLQAAANRGDFDAVISDGARIKELARVSGFVVSAAIVNVLQGMMMGELGQPAKGLEFLQDAANIQSFHLMDPWRIVTQAYLHGMLGEIKNAQAELEQARKEISYDDISNYGPVFVAIFGADVALAAGNYQEAIQETERMLPRVIAAQVKYLLPELLLMKARGHIGLDQVEQADTALEHAAQVARSIQDHIGLWQILAYRAKLETARGNADAARAARAEARTWVEWIANHSPVEYRSSFFARPLAQYVLASD